MMLALFYGKCKFDGRNNSNCLFVVSTRLFVLIDGHGDEGYYYNSLESERTCNTLFYLIIAVVEL